MGGGRSCNNPPEPFRMEPRPGGARARRRRGRAGRGGAGRGGAGRGGAGDGPGKHGGDGAGGPAADGGHGGGDADAGQPADVQPARGALLQPVRDRVPPQEPGQHGGAGERVPGAPAPPRPDPSRFGPLRPRRPGPPVPAPCSGVVHPRSPGRHLHLLTPGPRPPSRAALGADGAPTGGMRSAS